MRSSSRTFLLMAAFFSAAVLLPFFAFAQPGQQPPQGVVDARFNSVAVSNGASDYLLFTNNGHMANPTGDRIYLDDHFDLAGDMYVHGDDSGINSRIINEDTWFNGVRTLEYPVFVDDDLEVTGGVSAGAVSGAYGGFGELTAYNRLITNYIYPLGFSTTTQVPFSLDVRGKVYNGVAPLQLGNVATGNQDVVVNTHLKANNGIGTMYARSNSVSVNPGLYATLSVACDAGDKLLTCGAGGSAGSTSAFELNFLRAYPNWSDICQVVGTNKWGSIRQLEVHAKCWNQDG